MKTAKRNAVVYYGDFDANTRSLLPQLPTRFARLETNDVAALEELMEREVPFLCIFDVDKALREKDFPRFLERIGKSRRQAHTAKLLGLYSKSNHGKIEKLRRSNGAVCSILKKPLDAASFELAVLKAADLLEAEARVAALSADLERQRDDLDKFFEIGIALSTQQDLGDLLEQIVKECRRATRADAGSLYLVEELEPGDDRPMGAPYLRDKEHPKVLRFTVAQNHSISVPFKSFTMPVSTSSIAGYVAATGEVLNLKDVYKIPSKSPYGFNQGFDQQVGYRSCSMLVVPMRNRTGDIIGVLQLINKKKPGIDTLGKPERIVRQVEAFDEHDERLLLSLASQAAVSIEKVKLTTDIHNLFDALARSYARALEIRDPVTGGHCNRLVHYAMTLARKINEQAEGPFADVFFTEDEMLELKYASYLHDVGKIGVREAVLTKAHKLSPSEENALRSRFGFIQQSVLVDAYRHGRAMPGEDLPTEVTDELRRWQDDLEFLLDVNSRGWVKPEELDRVNEIAKREYVDVDRRRHPVLSEHELDNLTIQRGNLTAKERENIESHIALTWDLLQEIPWPKRFRNVPHIAGSHHEKLNGSGYPYGLTGDHLLLQAKMLAILDIFEALTARDRPYKPPMAIEKAVSILREEAEKGNLDKDLLDLFIDLEVWKDFQQTFDSLASKAETS